jgi:hypothetical protein
MITGSFYQSLDWPATGDFTGACGGAIDTGNALVGTIGEIFEQTTSDFPGGDAVHRFRKVFFRNEDASTVTSARTFFQEVKYPGQVRLAAEAVSGDASDNVITMPTGYVTGDFYNAIGLTEAQSETVLSGTLATDESFGIWLWLMVEPGLESDTNVPLNIRVAGELS